MGALICSFLDPFYICTLVGIISEILMGCLTVTFFKAVSLKMPLVADGKPRIIERGCKSIYMPTEDMAVILADDPILDRVWVFHQGA